MTTGLTYATYVTQIATLAVVPESDAAFVTILPQMITYAENRMYRELDFLSTVTTNNTYTTTAGTPFASFTLADFITLQQINVITPAGETVPNSGTRNPLLPATKEFLNLVYPSSSSAALPEYFAMFTQDTDNVVLFGPWPDDTYTLELVGTYRPASLSSVNTTTFISTYLPDLLIMASMIYVSGYQRNFGRANDDPQMAVTYESQYKALLQGATVEEARKKFQSSAWTSMSPATVASPTRG
jgi:hypothetical protein